MSLHRCTALKKSSVFLSSLLVVLGIFQLHRADARSPDAKELLAAAHMPSNYWFSKATLYNVIGTEQVWLVFGFNTPVADSESTCLSTGTSWEISFNPGSGAATAAKPEGEKLVYFGEGPIPSCRSMSPDTYAYVDYKLSTKQLQGMLVDLKKTAQCFASANENDFRCGLWGKATISNSRVVNEFAALSKLTLESAQEVKDGIFEFDFHPLRESDLVLVCTIAVDHDGSRELDVT